MKKLYIMLILLVFISLVFAATVDVAVVIDNGDDPAGAVVRLKHYNGEYDETEIVSSAITTFTDAPEGDYQLFVDLDGYLSYVNNWLVIDTDPFEWDVVLYAPNILWTEDFEADYSDGILQPAGWVNADIDGDTYRWMQFEPEIAASGIYCAGSESCSSQDYVCLDPENLLILPQINVPSDVEEFILEYWVAAGYYSNPPVEYSIAKFDAIPTQLDDINGHEEVFYETLDSDDLYNWKKRTISLIDYAGESFYIAFRHFNAGEYNGIVLIDNVSLISYGGVSNDTDGVVVPRTTALLPNYPNPFNPSTTITFIVGKQLNASVGMRGTDAINGSPTNVCIDIYNIKGQKVKTLVNDTFTTGVHSVLWNGTDDAGRSVSSGIYFYKMKTDDSAHTRKMILMK